MGMSVIISPATEQDTEQILKLQYLGYQSEAELYGDWSIEPLTQTLENLREELAGRHVLVARLGDEVVGAVRGWVEEDGVGRISRLVVHPGCSATASAVGCCRRSRNCCGRTSARCTPSNSSPATAAWATCACTRARATGRRRSARSPAG